MTGDYDGIRDIIDGEGKEMVHEAMLTSENICLRVSRAQMLSHISLLPQFTSQTHHIITPGSSLEYIKHL